MRMLSILIWTPLRFLSYAALALGVGLVILTLVRRYVLHHIIVSQTNCLKDQQYTHVVPLLRKRKVLRK